MTEWIVAITASLGILGSFIVVLWNTGRVIDRNTLAVNGLMKVIDKHEEKIASHEGKIIEFGTWKQMHEAHHD